MREYTCIHRDYPMPLTFVETNMDIARIKARMLLRSPRRLDRYVPLVDIAVIDVDASGRDRTISEYLLRANPVRMVRDMGDPGWNWRDGEDA